MKFRMSDARHARHAHPYMSVEHVQHMQVRRSVTRAASSSPPVFERVSPHAIRHSLHAVLRGPRVMRGRNGFPWIASRLHSHCWHATAQQGVVAVSGIPPRSSSHRSFLFFFLPFFSLLIPPSSSLLPPPLAVPHFLIGQADIALGAVECSPDGTTFQCVGFCTLPSFAKAFFRPKAGNGCLRCPGLA